MQYTVSVDGKLEREGIPSYSAARRAILEYFDWQAQSIKMQELTEGGKWPFVVVGDDGKAYDVLIEYSDM